MDFWLADTRILLLLLSVSTIAISAVARSPKQVDDASSPFHLNAVEAIELLYTSDADPVDVADGCQDAALHRCGSSMVRIFSLLDYIPSKESYKAKCTLRTEFFDCLRGEGQQNPCHKRHWRTTSDTRFRKKLMWSLWDTRGCVLRVMPDGTPL